LHARPAIALDIEASTVTGEVPPAPNKAIARADALGLAALHVAHP
jgi:hypothetical protein